MNNQGKKQATRGEKQARKQTNKKTFLYKLGQNFQTEVEVIEE